MLSSKFTCKLIFNLLVGLLLTEYLMALTSSPSGMNNNNKSIPNKNANSRSTSKNRKYKSDGLDVLESFLALEGNNPLDVHTLILGTLPSDKSYGRNLSSKEILLRGGDGHQNYGHSRNSFWNIVGSAFGFQRHRTPFAEQVRILTDEGYAVWDVLSEAKRKGSLDANLVKGSLVPADLPGFIHNHPNLNRLVFAANSAEVFCKKEVWADWLATGEAQTNATAMVTNAGEKLNKANQKVMTVKTKFWIRGSELNSETFTRTNTIFGRKKAVETVDDPDICRLYSNRFSIFEDDSDTDEKSRVIELIVMPSTSPASAQMRPPEKEKKWHMACYRLREPPSHYVCPGCEFYGMASSTNNNCAYERHWFHDCPHRDQWKVFKKEQNKKKPKQPTPTIASIIDPFYWYL